MAGGNQGGRQHRPKSATPKKVVPLVSEEMTASPVRSKSIAAVDGGALAVAVPATALGASQRRKSAAEKLRLKVQAANQRYEQAAHAVSVAK